MSDNDSSPNDSQAQIPARGWEEGGELLEAGRKEMLRLAARWPAQEQRRALIPDSLTEFDLTFQEMVGPKLLNLVVALAPMLASGVYDFSEALDAVWRVAARHGAGHLSDTAQSDWRDWIGKELLARLDDPWPEGLVKPSRLARITRVAAREG